MKTVLIIVLSMAMNFIHAQSLVYPIVKNYGGIYPVPDAVERPDPSMNYNIVVDLAGGSDRPDQINNGLNNIARMINLHSVGGVPKERINVVVAIHNEAAYTILNNDAYKERYKVDNPNLDLYKELAESGVKLWVCGQSLTVRKIDRNAVTNQIGIATSMLTVLSTYQLKGYAAFKF